jgi:hypothetical protein
MKRIEVNVKTGEVLEIDLTPEEVAIVAAAQADEIAKQVAAPPSLEQRIAALESVVFK